MGFEELMPGKGKKRPLKKRDGSMPEVAPAPAPTPTPEPAPVVEAPADTVRVRILARIVSRKHGSFFPGHVAHLPVILARDWADKGMVEYDKSLDGAPETK